MQALLEALLKYNIKNPEAALQKMKDYFAYLIEENKKINLTAITDEAEAEQKHFVDSLAALPYIGNEVLDLGAGAGFPGIPLAICKENGFFTLVDSIGKKTQFLEKVQEKIPLTNVTVLKSRAEDLSKEKKYDTALARGVGPLATVCEYSLPFLKTGGLLIAYKAQKANEEIKEAQNALKVLGGAVEKTVPYTLTVNGETHERNLILIRKTKPCDPKYPRGGNKPRSAPL